VVRKDGRGLGERSEKGFRRVGRMGRIWGGGEMDEWVVGLYAWEGKGNGVGAHCHCVSDSKRALRVQHHDKRLNY
jgi:hypothetical protein